MSASILEVYINQLAENKAETKAGTEIKETDESAKLEEALDVVGITPKPRDFNIKDYQKLLALTRLAYAKEKNGVPEEHAAKLIHAFGSFDAAIAYLRRYEKANSGRPQLIHDAALFTLPSGKYNIQLWQALARQHMPNEEFEDVLAYADKIEQYIIENRKSVEEPVRRRILAQKEREFGDEFEKESMGEIQTQINREASKIIQLEIERTLNNKKKELKEIKSKIMELKKEEKLIVQEIKRAQENKQRKIEREKEDERTEKKEVIAQEEKLAETLRKQIELEEKTIRDKEPAVRRELEEKMQQLDGYVDVMMKFGTTQTDINKKVSKLIHDQLQKDGKLPADRKEAAMVLRAFADSKEGQLIREKIEKESQDRFAEDFNKAKKKSSSVNADKQEYIDKKLKEKNKVIQRDIENACARVLSEDTPLETLQSYVSFVSFKNAAKHPKAAKEFFKKVSETAFDKYLTLKLSETSRLPEVFIDGEKIGYPGFYIKRISAKDPRAAIIGKHTSCCQWIGGGGGERAAIESITNPDCGVYVLFQKQYKEPSEDDPILAQGWAWLGEGNRVVFDSIESQINFKKENPRLLTDFFVLLAHRLATEQLTIEQGFNEVYVGGGATPDELRKIKTESVFPKSFKRYGDSNIQFLMGSKSPFVALAYLKQYPDSHLRKILELRKPTEKEIFEWVNYCAINNRSDLLSLIEKNEAIDDLENRVNQQFKLARSYVKGLSREFSTNRTSLFYDTFKGSEKPSFEDMKEWMEFIAVNYSQPLEKLRNNSKEGYNRLMQHFDSLNKVKGLLSKQEFEELMEYQNELKRFNLGYANFDALKPYQGLIEKIRLQLKDNFPDFSDFMHGISSKLSKEESEMINTYKEMMEKFAKNLSTEEYDKLIQHHNQMLELTVQQNIKSYTHYLIKKGANFNLKTFDALSFHDSGLSILHIAANKNNISLGLDLIRELVQQQGMDINMKTNNGRTALSIAAQLNNLDMVKLLVGNKADINLADKDGYSPLSYAIYNNHLDVCLFLISQGADLNNVVLQDREDLEFKERLQKMQKDRLMSEKLPLPAFERAKGKESKTEKEVQQSAIKKPGSIEPP